MNLTKISMVLMFMISCVGLSSPQAVAQGKNGSAKKKTAVVTKTSVAKKTTASSKGSQVKDTQATVKTVSKATGEINKEESVEDTMLDTMLPQKFPEKSHFIADQDAKKSTSPVSIDSDESVKKETVDADASEPVVKQDVIKDQTVSDTDVPDIQALDTADPDKNASLLEAKKEKSSAPKSLLPDFGYDPDKLEEMAVPIAGGIAGIVVLLLIWRSLQKRASKLFSGGGKLNVLAQQSVGQHAKIVIVQALGRKYLIGVTDQNVQLVADLDFYETSDEDVENTYVSPANFESSVAGASARSSVAASGAADKIREKVKGLKKI